MMAQVSSCVLLQKWNKDGPSIFDPLLFPSLQNIGGSPKPNAFKLKILHIQFSLNIEQDFFLTNWILLALYIQKTASNIC